MYSIYDRVFKFTICYNYWGECDRVEWRNFSGIRVRAPKPLQDKEDRLRRWREWARRVAETAEHRQERLTKCRERAGHSTLTAAA